MDGSGCVQYPNGQLMVTYNALEGTGMVLSRAGEITETLRGGPGAGCRDYALDDHLGVRLDLEGQEHAVYFAAGSVKHKFVLGRNEPAATWDDDPAFAASLSRSVRATARVDRPHAGKAPLNKVMPCLWPSLKLGSRASCVPLSASADHLRSHGRDRWHGRSHGCAGVGSGCQNPHAGANGRGRRDHVWGCSGQGRLAQGVAGGV